MLIGVYPIEASTTRQYYVTVVNKHADVYFGPLSDGMVVDGECLPALLRSTCVAASRALRRRIVGDDWSPALARHESITKTIADSTQTASTFADLYTYMHL